METEDPRAAVHDKSVAVRAAAARDLARIGTWEDLPLLVQCGWEDKSIAVRLYMAAAAADIAARGLGAPGQTRWSSAQRAQLLTWAFQADPGTNPSMLMLVAAAEPKQVLARLARILRDPRSDVRLGAVTGLRRMLLSGAGHQEGAAEAMATWLADDRVADDTRAELVKLVGEVGMPSLRAAVLQARVRGGAMAEVADEALDRLAMREDVGAWTGLWQSDGLDVFELPTEAVTTRLGFLTSASWSEAGDTRPVRFDAGVLTVDGQPARLLWATPLGHTAPERALQIGGHTWWAVSGTAGADLVATHHDAMRGFSEDARTRLVSWADGMEGAAGQRASVIARSIAGDHQGVVAILDPVLAKKRPRTDLYFWRAHARAALGETAGALADLTLFLDKAKKDAPLRDEAQALHDRLTG